MSEIKSQKALRYILSPESCDTGSIGMIRAVALAEQEAEERHEQQLQGLKDKAIEAFKHVCYCREKEYVHLGDYTSCDSLKKFIQELS